MNKLPFAIARLNFRHIAWCALKNKLHSSSSGINLTVALGSKPLLSSNMFLCIINKGTALLLLSDRICLKTNKKIFKLTFSKMYSLTISWPAGYVTEYFTPKNNVEFYSNQLIKFLNHTQLKLVRIICPINMNDDHPVNFSSFPVVAHGNFK